jgi:hypothetical protein
VTLNGHAGVVLRRPHSKSASTLAALPKVLLRAGAEAASHHKGAHVSFRVRILRRTDARLSKQLGTSEYS